MKIPSIKIGKFHVQMTEDEKEELLALLAAHAEKYGTTHGFIAHVIEALHVHP